MKEFSFGGSDKNIILIGAVRGLVSEGRVIEERLNSISPDVIGLSISPEELRGLQYFLKEPFKVGLSDYDIIYGYKLAKYGEVMVPPPIFVNALQYAENHGIETVSLDSAESDFSDSYVRNIGINSLVKHSLRKAKLRKKDFGDTSPEEFTVMWQTEMEKIKGFRELQMSRIDDISAGIILMYRDSMWKSSVVIMEYEIFDPVLQKVRSALDQQ